MIEQELVKQAAEEAGIEADREAVDAQIQDLRAVFDSDDQFRMKLEADGYTEESFRRHIERMTAGIVYLERIRADASDVRDAEVEAFYAENEYRLTLPEQVRVRHILLKWKPLGTQDDRAAIREQMQPVLKRARAGEDFAALATEYSEDSATKVNGGDTGFFPRGTMVPAFEEAAFALQPGEVSDPVDTVFGVHILKLEERTEPRLLPLEQYREQLRDYVREEKMAAAVDARIEELRESADIEVLIPLAARN
jgi:parvulin-like peptidyl-prolyl isomerase